MPLHHVSSTLDKAVQEPDWRRQWGHRGRAWRALSRLGLTGLHAAPIHRNWLDVRRVLMPLRGLPDSLVGKRIVQISDLHVSPVVWSGYVRQQLRHVAELRPDLLVVTGDLITGGYRYATRAAALLAEIDPKPPLGVVCTLGNHDYGSVGARGREGERRAVHLADALARRDLTLLRNEARTITGLTLVGLDDIASGRLDADRAFRNVNGGPTICLNHDPRNADDLLDFPWQWMLAGHTHGRQLAESYVGRRFNKKRRRRYVRGLYDVGNDRKLYVNRGLSYGQRWQSWCKPEITVFKLARPVESTATS